MGRIKNHFKRKKFKPEEKKILAYLLTPIPRPETVTEEYLSGDFLIRAKNKYQTHSNDIVARLSRNISAYSAAMQNYNYNQVSDLMERTAYNDLLKTLKSIEKNDSTMKTIIDKFKNSLDTFHQKISKPVIGKHRDRPVSST